MSNVTAAYNDDVEVRPTDTSGVGVFALRDFKRGETVVVGRSVSVHSERTIFTIQTGPETHVLMDEPAIRLNHSFHPNTAVRDNAFGAYDFVAISDIAAGDEISFDYETTESDLTEEFQRCCPAPSDRSAGNGRGFGSLTLEVRARYGDLIADYLKSDAS
jgi:hypothetical protein